MAVYYASKAYLRSLSEALWAEAAGSGVAISCLCPGPVRTPFLRRAGVGRSWLFRLLPKADPRRVAERGWAGFRRGRRIIMPDPISWLTATTAPLLPRALLLPVMRQWQRAG
jgi:short-subunit dehydrogenase